MRCEDALAGMLDAEPGDLLSGAGTLGAHISSCQRCFAVAQTLSGETERLADAFEEPHGVALAVKYRNRQRVRRRITTPVTAVAAALLVWLMVRPVAEPVVQPPVIRIPERAAVHVEPGRVIQTFRAAPQIERPPVRLPPPPPTLPVAVQAVAVVTPPRPADAVTADLHVDPEPGTRATVMRGRNPNVTVVWLTK